MQIDGFEVDGISHRHAVMWKSCSRLFVKWIWKRPFWKMVLIDLKLIMEIYLCGDI